MSIEHIIVSRNRTPSFHYGHVVVGVALLIMVIAWGVNYSFGIFFTPLLQELHWTRAMTSGAFSVAILLEGFGGMFMGRICDRCGARLVMTICGLLLGLGYFMMSQVSSTWHLYLYYGVIVGIGLSGTYVPLTSTVARWFDRQRGLMTGIVSSGIGAGTLIMTPLANRLISTYGWRSAYMLAGGVTLGLIGLSAQFLRMPRQDDLLNRMVPVAGDPEPGRSSTAAPASLAAALRTGTLWLLCAVLLCWGTVSFVILVHIAPFAIDAGFSETEAASILAIFGGTVFVAKILVGITADAIGSRRAFIAGLAMMTAGLVWLLAFRELWALYLFAAVYAFGYGCGSVIMPTIVAEIFGLGSHGILLGIINFFACIGCAIGPVAAGCLFDRSGNYQSAFLLTTLLSAACLGMAFCIQRKTGK